MSLANYRTWFILGLILCVMGCCMLGGISGPSSSGSNHDSGSSGSSSTDSGSSWGWSSSGSDSGSWDSGGSDSGSW
jgi:hypothetical protein